MCRVRAKTEDENSEATLTDRILVTIKNNTFDTGANLSDEQSARKSFFVK